MNETKVKKHSEKGMVRSEETLDPLTLVLITAAVSAVYGKTHLRRVRLVGAGARYAGAWGQVGRRLQQGSHVVKN